MAKQDSSKGNQSGKNSSKGNQSGKDQGRLTERSHKSTKQPVARPPKR